ncbi:hypothetical protein [Phenylobacterium sp. J367]|uniref:hypothetical protein n=1 Tax=Phenylobacterium sp. J367 TaxID=2898435 RepID=UPI0021512E08|nr:hypothetical protein [Phenylobacterium sp. J367]MCR5880219.1 hypothetical protein [Phenylobacterium sp. J367]
MAVIGTGSSAIQSITEIARTASHVYVLQRTPNFSVPARNRPLTEQDYAAFWEQYPAYRQMVLEGAAGIAGGSPFRSLTAEQQRARFEELWNIGGAGYLGALADLLTNPVANAAAADFVREKIRETVKDPAVAEALSPDDHPIGAKRICVDTGYYEIFNQENVTLVNLRQAPIASITPQGVRTTAQEYSVDAIVYATGFDAMTGALLNIDIVGEGGVSLAEAWRDGPKTYLGLQVAGFPQLLHHHRSGQPLGAVQHDQQLRAARRMDHRLLGVAGRQRSRCHRGRPAGPRGLGPQGQRGRRPDPLPEGQQLVHRGEHPRKAAGLHALRRRPLPTDLQHRGGGRIPRVPSLGIGGPRLKAGGADMTRLDRRTQGSSTAPSQTGVTHAPS